jgi:16S rRNA processing protein RimM
MTGEAAGAEGFVPVAEITRPVGLRGEVKLYPLLDWHEPLLGSRFLILDDGAAVTVGAVRPGKGGYVVALAGCTDQAAAADLVGRRLGFRRADYEDDAFPRPPAGLPFRFLGRPVRLAGGDEIGIVDEVRRYADQLMLVIIRAGREVLVPAVEPILRHDPGLAGPLVIDPPEGLLDVAGD